jgi:phosphoribosylformylglycinamidine cyclo-ligase
MPDVYKENEYDLAGFIVGVVEKQRVLTGKDIKPRDKIIGLASNGLHSNGFSLVRKVLEKNKIALSDKIDGIVLADELLRPTRIYVKAILKLLNRYSKNNVKALAHITGGGIPGNLSRVLPHGTHAVIYKSACNTPRIFEIISSLGNIPEKEMFNTFNMGIGMIIIVQNDVIKDLINGLKNEGITSYIIGEIKRGSRGVTLT